MLIAGEEIAKTEHVSKNLSPKWNAKVLTGYKIGPTFGENPEIRLCIFDYDLVSAGDPMGDVVLPLEKLLDGKELDDWLPVRPCKDCPKDRKSVV